MIDVSIRLRRAIHLNDLSLVHRILKNNPRSLRNPDFIDKSNTSLHLAAQLGCLEIVLLITLDHEVDGISRNADNATPLLLAIEADAPPVVEALARRFPHSIPYHNKYGVDALMAASRTGTHSLITTLLTLSPLPPAALLAACDLDGNTALHYASAYGHLKCIRTLLQEGANPGARNAYSWTPIHYSSTVAAEVYFNGLVVERERQREEEGEREREMARRREGGVRVVDEGEEGKRRFWEQGEGEGRMTPMGGGRRGFGGRVRAVSGE